MERFDRKRFLMLGGAGVAAAVVAPGTAQAAPAADTSLVFNVKDFGARGDGSFDDTPGINAAVQAAAGGGTVYFPPGNFRVNGEIVIRADNTVLRGAGWSSRLTQLGTRKATLRFREVDGGVVRDLSFTGNGSEHVSGILVTAYNDVAAIRFDQCTNVAVTGCRIVQHAGGGIRWTGSLTGALFDGNTITGVGGGDKGPIKHKDNNNDFAIGQSASTTSDNIIIRGNTISGHCFGIGSGIGTGLVISGNIIHDIPGQHGMYLASPNSAQISGNVVRKVGLNCVNVQIAEKTGPKANEEDVRSLVITDNVLHDGAAGVVLNTTDKVIAAGFRQPIIAGNSIRAMSEYGIAADRTWEGSITGNTITDVTLHGVLLKAFSGALRDNTVMRTNRTGVYVDLIGDVHSAGNVVTDCAREPVGDDLPCYVNVVRSNTSVLGPVFHSDSDVLHAIAPESPDLRKSLRGSAGTVLFVRGLINRTSKPWEFKGELLHLDFAYSTAEDVADPAAPVHGSGRRELHGLQDPVTAGLTTFFQPGDICWHAKPTAGGTPGWLCVAAGRPGTWKAMAALAP